MRQLLFAAIWCALTAACTSESYDSGDTSLSYLSAEWADVTTNSDGLVAYAHTDAGQRLTFSPPYQATWIGQKADTTCRAVLYHGQVSGETTSVKALSPVLMASVTDRTEEITAKKDPIGGARAWISADKRYLNIVLTLKVGRKENAPTQQKVGFLCDSVTTLADGTRCCWLTLVHDQNGVPDYYSQEANVSVPAEALHQADKVCLRVMTTQGEKLLEVRETN